MDKQTAVKIIRDTFEKLFDKGRFIKFSKNLVNFLDDSSNFVYQGNYIPDAYKPYIHTLERIGKYQDVVDNKIDILIAQLKKETSLERARTMQRNFIAWYLNGSRGGDLKDAALVAFVSPNNEDWRFSLVKMDYLLEESPSGKTKVKTELTPARRFSFLVGVNESSHTAQSQLVDILADDKNNPTLSILENAFNIEVATKEFFNRYRQLFHKVQETLDELVEEDEIIRENFKTKGVNTVDFSKKLLGQIVFLYFLQKKGWLGVPGNKNWGEGNKKFLRTLFEECNKEGKNFFNDYLEYLFYDALNNEDRGGIDPSYYHRFECRIPFLNGGLFTSDYDWGKTKIVIPNDIFSNKRNETTDEGSGILDIFNLYNFTVKEDEPLEKEVAVDPEMLGKVFENLLEVKDRKSKGTYYTPREIVHYMCQESLINYLDTAINTTDIPLVQTRPPQGKLFGQPEPQQAALKAPQYRVLVPWKDIEEFVRKGESTIEHDSRVVKYGRETERYSYKLPESIRQNAKLVDDKLDDIRVCDPAVGSGAFLVNMMTEVIRARNILTTHLSDKRGRTNYNFKRHAIQNCLYGVDIDPGAVEIAKLRLWLSLVVDEEDIRQIQPLPNLDYKIVCGNSLLGVEKNLFNLELFNNLENLKSLYFSETNTTRKQEYKAQIDALINQITNNNQNFDFEVYFSEVFHDDNRGFDVVIANPPHGAKLDSRTINYISHSNLGIEGSHNSAILFTKKGLQLTRTQGLITFVIPKSFCYSDSWNAARLLLYKELLSLLDVSMGFENVLLEQVVFVAKKGEISPMIVTGKMLEGGKLVNNSILDKKSYDLFGTYITGLTDEEVKIGEKIRSNDATFAKVCHIKRGVDIQDYLTKHNWKVEVFRAKSIGRYILKAAKEGLTSANARHLNSEITYMRQPKIIIQNIVAHITKPHDHIMIMATIDRQGVIGLGSIGNIYVTDKTYTFEYLTALLNSNLISWYAYHFIYGNAIRTMRFDNYHLSRLPLVEVSETNQKPFLTLVNRILSITKDEDYMSNSIKQSKVKEYERQIDQMVYELYGLTPEEIAAVEGLEK